MLCKTTGHHWKKKRYAKPNNNNETKLQMNAKHIDGIWTKWSFRKIIIKTHSAFCECIGVQHYKKYETKRHHEITTTTKTTTENTLLYRFWIVCKIQQMHIFTWKSYAECVICNDEFFLAIIFRSRWLFSSEHIEISGLIHFTSSCCHGTVHALFYYVQCARSH